MLQMTLVDSELLSSGELSPAASGRLIASRAEQVEICDGGVVRCAEDVADRVVKGEITISEMFCKTPVHPQTADDAGINWVFFADTLNFSFWQPEGAPQYEVTYGGARYTGYLALCAAINRALEGGTSLTDPSYYATVSTDTLKQLLSGDGCVSIPLLEERVRCLHEVGSVLKEKWGGSFVGVFEAAGKSAPRLLQLVLENFPCFRDYAEFEGTKVSFLKRAQILVADLWCLFEGRGRGQLEDIERLTMFADYRVPQSLRYYGVLEFKEQLRKHLEEERLLEAGDRWELEIRGCSIEAVQRITERARSVLAQRGSEATVNAVLVDQFLWGFRRKHAEDMKKIPYHKVRSIYY